MAKTAVNFAEHHIEEWSQLEDNTKDQIADAIVDYAEDCLRNAKGFAEEAQDRIDDQIRDLD